MSIAALNWARLQKTGSMKRKAVLRALADYSDEKGLSWPSQKRLSDDTEMSERSVREAISELSALGFIDVVPVKNADGTRQTNRMVLHFERVQRQISPVDEPEADFAISSGRFRQNQRQNPPKPAARSASKPFIEPSLEPPEEPPKRTREKTPPDFDAFWSAYPHKVAKDAAKRAFAKARKSASLSDLLAGLDRYKACKPTDREWCHPTTWLNQGRWMDEPDENNGAMRAQQSQGRDNPFFAIAREIEARQTAGVFDALSDPFGPDPTRLRLAYAR